jgi:predicted dehydrogenase
MVAEDWRYRPGTVEAAEVLSCGELGTPRLAQLSAYFPVVTGGPFDTPWRHQDGYKGGYILDGGVHIIAQLRAILGEIVEVSSHTRHLAPQLPSPDSLSASLLFASDLLGSLLVTYGLAGPAPISLLVTCDRGVLRLDGETLSVTEGSHVRTLTHPGDAVEAELAAFASAVRQGLPHRNAPEEALRDLAVIEALLASARTGAHTKVA